MKKFLVLFAIFAILIFVASCGGSKKTEDNSDTGETVTDEDTVDTEPTGDTEPADDTDTTYEPNDDDADTAQGPDPCSDDPCAGIENATGCISHGDYYECDCIENYA